jgi:hypothetical protein
MSMTPEFANHSLDLLQKWSKAEFKVVQPSNQVEPLYVFRKNAEQRREVGRGDLPIKLTPSAVVQD